MSRHGKRSDRSQAQDTTVWNTATGGVSDLTLLGKVYVVLPKTSGPGYHTIGIGSVEERERLLNHHVGQEE